LGGEGINSNLSASLQLEMAKLNQLNQQHQQAAQNLQQQQNNQLIQVCACV